MRYLKLTLLLLTAFALLLSFTATALSDGAQSLTPAAFAQLAQKVRCLREALQ